MIKLRLRDLHKWAGLIGALWLAVLGFSGLILDHRDDWRWAWRLRVPEALIPEARLEALTSRHITLLQANPANAADWLAGGAAGLWHKSDGMETWPEVYFEGLAGPPMVYAIHVDEALGWERVWLATDDGLWQLLPDQPLLAVRAGLAGRRLTALAGGAGPGSLVAVEKRSRILTIAAGQTEPSATIDLARVSVANLPERLSWSRFIFDTHLGRSFFRRDANLLLNDWGALAFVLLGLTGAAHFFWRRVGRGRRAANPRQRQRLLQLHSSILGLAAVVPILYLSLSGIVMDHRDQWMSALVGNSIDRDLLPGVYDFRSLIDEVSHVVAYPGQPERFTVGTRLGVLSSDDNGRSWRREGSSDGGPAPGFVWSLRRMEGNLVAGGLGGPSFYRPLDGGDWRMVPRLIGMPSDLTRSEERWFALNGNAVLSGDLATGFSAAPLRPPRLAGAPLMLVMFDIHNGRIITEHARYALDLMALLAIFMVASGPVLWWRRRRKSARADGFA